MLSKKTKNYSSNICKSSSNLLKTITKPTTYKKYEKYIKDITNKFTDSQNTNTNKLLNDLFATKDNNQFTFTFTEIPLNNHNCIPPFIDIFRYLITKPEYIDKFTADEQMQLHNNLSKHHTLESCYKFIEKSQIGKKILTYYDSISHNLKTELITKYPSIEFHKLLINKFTSIKIIKDLDLRIKKLICLSVEWQGRKLDNLVYMFMYGDSDDSSDSGDSGGIDYYKNISHSIIERILFFNKFLNIAKLPSKFIIFLTDKKKEIDDDVVLHMHFKTINVNTAVTNGRDIIIYRQQELLKSIFHELIHFHNLDFRQIPNSIIQYLIKTHNIKSDNKYLLYECVTESMANILNNIFLSSNIKDFIHNLQNEILFSTLQVVKILNICGYKKWDEFANLYIHSTTTNNSNTNNSNPKKQFKQDSCIMSYYILKFYIMMNLDIYFKKCLDTKIKFIQTNESFNNLIHIFDLARKNIYIKEFMDNALRQIGNSKNSNHISNHNRTQKNIKKERTKETAKQKINKTLRMTCLESNLFIKNSI